MAGDITKPLADVLRAERADFNQRFRLAQQRYRGLAAEDWLAYLRDTLGPVAGRVAAHDAEKLGAVIDVLYDQALPLVAQHWLGPQAREPVLPSAYRHLLCALAPALAQDPLRLSGSLLNALYQICRQDALRAQAWADRVADCAANITDIDTVLALGTLLAWHAGLPAYRAAAVRAGAGLPPALAQAALGLAKAPTPDLWEALQRAPTLRPDEIGSASAPVLEWLGWSGGYRGLGGPFVKRPAVGVAGGKLAASDGAGVCWLAADGYGVQTIGMGAAEDWPLQPAPALVRVSTDGTVTSRNHAQKFIELETAEACVWHAGILAVTLRTSYQVALLRFPLP
jgi:hypothetical protein